MTALVPKYQVLSRMRNSLNCGISSHMKVPPFLLLGNPFLSPHMSHEVVVVCNLSCALKMRHIKITHSTKQLNISPHKVPVSAGSQISAISTTFSVKMVSYMEAKEQLWACPSCLCLVMHQQMQANPNPSAQIWAGKT